MEKKQKLNWAIFYQYVGTKGVHTQPVFGSNDGKYYLGGSRSIGYLLFTRKVDAEREASKVRKDPWFKNDSNVYQGKVIVKEFIIKAI